MKFSLSEARAYARNGIYGPAIAHYMAVLKSMPVTQIYLYEREFFDCFEQFVLRLENEGKRQEAAGYFSVLADVYVMSSIRLCLYGEFHMRGKIYDAATFYFVKSLECDPTNDRAKRSLRKLRALFIDQWHFRMLNDRQRNEAYEQALTTIIAHAQFYGPINVMDIGAGTGILSMLALEAGAQKVYAIEHSPIMLEMAEQIIKENGYGKNNELILIGENSKKLELDDFDDDRINLIVTELMDAGFFGEGIVGTLLDVKKRFLTSSDSLIIPSRAKIYACLIECEFVRKSNTVTIETAQKNRFYSSLCFDTPNTTNIEDGLEKKREPYTSMMLSKVKNGFRYLSQPFVVDKIDLNDLNDLQRHEIGFTIDFKTKLIDNGYVDAIVCWFEVDLLPPSISSKNRIFISTNPENVETCWEQAIFPIPFTNTKNQLGEEMEIRVEIRDDWMKCTMKKLVPVENILIIDDDSIELLNDDYLFDFYSRAWTTDQDNINAENSALVDFTNNPRLTFLLLSDPRQVFSTFSTKHDCEKARFYLKSIDSRMEIEPKREFKSEEDLKSQTKGEKLNFDYLLFLPIESCGLLKEGILEAFVRCRLRYKNNGISPIIIPNTIDVMGMLVESDELERYTRIVNDQNTLGLKIKDTVNIFETDIQRDIELSTLNYKPLSEQIKLMTLNLMEPIDENDNRLPNFISQTTENRVKTIGEGKVNALIFWYEFSTEEGIRFSTADSKSHYRVAAAMTDSCMAKDCSVKVNDTVYIKMTLDQSEFFVYFSVVEKWDRKEKPSDK